MSADTEPSQSRNGSATQLDEKSKAIIEQLQADGRRSYSAIGSAVGLSEAAVRQRVARLVDSGAIQIVAVTDPLQLGFTHQAMLGIKVSGDIRAVAGRIAELPEVDYLVITAGSFDIIAEIVCESDEHLFSTVNDRIRGLDHVVSTETFMYMSLQKQHYNWGTR